MRGIVLRLSAKVPGSKNDRTVGRWGGSVPLFEGPVADVDADGAEDEKKFGIIEKLLSTDGSLNVLVYVK